MQNENEMEDVELTEQTQMQTQNSQNNKKSSTPTPTASSGRNSPKGIKGHCKRWWRLWNGPPKPKSYYSIQHKYSSSFTRTQIVIGLIVLVAVYVSTLAVGLDQVLKLNERMDVLRKSTMPKILDSDSQIDKLEERIFRAEAMLDLQQDLMERKLLTTKMTKTVSATKTSSTPPSEQTTAYNWENLVQDVKEKDHEREKKGSSSGSKKKDDEEPSQGE